MSVEVAYLEKGDGVCGGRQPPMNDCPYFGSRFPVFPSRVVENYPNLFIFIYIALLLFRALASWQNTEQSGMLIRKYGEKSASHTQDSNQGTQEPNKTGSALLFGALRLIPTTGKEAASDLSTVNLC